MRSFCTQASQTCFPCVSPTRAYPDFLHLRQFFDLTASSGRGVGIGGGRPRVVLDRPAMNEKQLHERFQYEAAAAAAGSPYLPWSGGGGGGGGSSPPSNAGRWANKAAVQPSAARLLGRAKQSCRRCSPAAVFLALFPILDW